MVQPRAKNSNVIAFIHHRGEFDTVPSLMGSVNLLLREGYAIDLIYVADPSFDAPRFDDAGVRLVALPSLRRVPLPTSLRRILEAL
ncbi:MAG: hypothetical protein H8D34_00780, partial [Chloroflexi bacterium]|nr:hypothetical protein [Chloroflexota bacterium]